MITNKRKVDKAEGSAGFVQTNHELKQINLYQSHPMETISLHEFYQVALNRLQALRKIEFM